jgi:hypothetical protein
MLGLRGKLAALPLVWRNMEALLIAFYSIEEARKLLALHVETAKSAADLLVAQQAEIDRLNRVAADDARLLLAYARWCEKQHCAPSKADLASMVQK